MCESVDLICFSFYNPSHKLEANVFHQRKFVKVTGATAFGQFVPKGLKNWPYCVILCDRDQVPALLRDKVNSEKMACCVKGCSSRGGRKGDEKKSLFTPRTNDMFNSWYNIMCTKNVQIKKSSRICELHFKSEDIIKEDAFLQKDGTVIYVKRQKPKLKEGAIPSIFQIEKISCFQQIEHNNNQIMSYEKSLTECENIEINLNSMEEPIPSSSHEINKSQIIKDKSVTSLKKTVPKFSIENINIGRNIELPTAHWFANITDTYMMWTCWTIDLSSILRRVIVKANMQIQVTKLCYKITHLKNKCAKSSEEILEQAILKLPEKQQLAVKACFAAAKLKKQSGLKVDAVVSDGASWNRSMWNLFGVTEECVSIQHIVDIERRLWFISDFPHLIKCFRNYFSQFDRYAGIWTPDGVVSLKHWYAILAIENPCGFNLKSSYHLDEHHIKPKYYQKMNVVMAFRFFNVAPTMQLFKEANIHHDLNDADGSIKFCKRVNALITAMNSRTFKNSLRPDNEMYKRFFGMMRSCCGSNDHPNSQLFIQMYRLISTYSLIKPPKGCNVSTGELMNVLLNIKDISDNKEREEQWTAQIDTILDRGRNTEILAYVPSILNDHDSHICTTSDYVLTYVAGYVARKGNRFCKDINNKNFICEECLKTLVLQPNDEIPERHKLIEIKTKGYLVNPSRALFDLLSSLEKGVIEGTKCGKININTLFEIMELIDEEKNPITFLGCEKHNYEFTKNIICFYLITRMFFLVKQANKNDNTEKKKTKEKRKCSKLVHSNGPNVSNVDFQIKETNAIETVIQMNYGKRRKIGTNIPS